MPFEALEYFQGLFNFYSFNVGTLFVVRCKNIIYAVSIYFMCLFFQFQVLVRVG